MLKIILLISCFLVTNGCSNNGISIIEEIKTELAIANKNLGVDEIKTIKLKNTLEKGDLMILTQPYIEKESLAKLIKDKELLNKIWGETSKQEGIHIYIINGNQIKTHETLGRYVGVDGIFYTTNKNIALKVKKLNRHNRPLIIKGVK
ncbi:MAG: hypothetical protein KAS46_08670 [Candidatus Aureabacteria bacterium]|nr:hypothetical protein [Candidatus Auribacterota bacterium]